MFDKLKELYDVKKSYIAHFGEPIPLGLQWKIDSMELGYQGGKEEQNIYRIKSELLQNVALEEKECKCKTCLVAREEIKDIIKV